MGRITEMRYAAVVAMIMVKVGWETNT